MTGPGGIPEVDVRELRMVRLGQDLDRTGRIADEALARALAAVDEYAAIIRSYDVPPSRVRFVATSASRDASNSDVFVAGVRDHHQSKIAETQGEVAKKLTVIASLVLVPSLIVGFYGQNFVRAFDEPYWSLGVSCSLIVASTLVQLALFRWRRWI